MIGPGESRTSPAPSGSKWGRACTSGEIGLTRSGRELHSLHVTEDADLETRVDEAKEPVAQRGRYSFASVELKWLPVSESAFLLWVLAALFGVWLLVGYLLGLI